MSLTRDGRLLFAARIVRLFAYGFLSVVLVLYLAALGLPEPHIGLLLTLTLIGDTAISLCISTRADRVGRKRMLLLGAALMALAGVGFAATGNFVLLLVTATIGVISPSGSEVGPFLAIEQAALAQTIPPAKRTAVFAWYGLAGSMATALGALVGGVAADLGRRLGAEPLARYRVVLVAYAVFGVALAAIFARLSRTVEAPVPSSAVRPGLLGLHRSRGVVLRLSALFGIDAFAGGFIVQSLVAYWFRVRFGTDDVSLGAIFFASNALAGLSALAASAIASRIGLVNTMVFTHIPSSVLLVIVPLMPVAPLAIALWLLRACISQMDVPTRQSYTLAVVEPDERAAAAGVTGVARTIGASGSPALSGILMSHPGLFAVPFFLAGGLKILYDLLLLARFRRVRPKEEIQDGRD